MLVFLLCSSQAFAVNDWKGEAGLCKQNFQYWQNAPVERLSFCMRVWGMYRNPQAVPENERNLAIPAFQRVYTEGDPQERFDAAWVLRSLNAPIPQNVGPAKTSTSSGPRTKARKKFEPKACSRSQRKRAKGHNSRGYKEYKKGRFSKALSYYQKAMDTCETHLRSTFNTAAVLARMERVSESNEILQRLVDIGTEDALAQVYKARKDIDFMESRGNARFKKVSGYVRIRLLNGAIVGEQDFGEDEIKRIEKYLDRLHHEVANKGVDKRSSKPKYPMIWYKPSVKVQAALMKKLVDHPKTKLVEMGENSKYDIIISWCVKLVKNDFGETQPEQVARSLDPENIDDEMKSLERSQDQALRKPKDALNKTNQVLSTPDNVSGSIDRSISSGKSLINKIPGL
jgi:tetratricopeptide (TPR) repeat protein